MKRERFYHVTYLSDSSLQSKGKSTNEVEGEGGMLPYPYCIPSLRICLRLYGIATNNLVILEEDYVGSAVWTKMCGKRNGIWKLTRCIPRMKRSFFGGLSRGKNLGRRVFEPFC